jgi:hypothetical protein
MWRKSVYLRRLVYNRKSGAPKWILKSDQIALLLLRRGIEYKGIGESYWHKEQERLYMKYIVPLLDR